LNCEIALIVHKVLHAINSDLKSSVTHETKASIDDKYLQHWFYSLVKSFYVN